MWLTLYTYKKFCHLCDKGAVRTGPGTPPKSPLQTYSVGVQMERLATDGLGPLPLTNKKHYIYLCRTRHPFSTNNHPSATKNILLKKSLAPLTLYSLYLQPSSPNNMMFTLVL